MSALEDSIRECLKNQVDSISNFGGSSSDIVFFIVNNKGGIGVIFERMSDAYQPTYNGRHTLEEAQKVIEMRLGID